MICLVALLKMSYIVFDLNSSKPVTSACSGIALLVNFVTKPILNDSKVQISSVQCTGNFNTHNYAAHITVHVRMLFAFS